MLIFLGRPCLNLPLLGVQVLLLDLQVDPEAIETFDRLAELTGVVFFHIRL